MKSSREVLENSFKKFKKNRPESLVTIDLIQKVHKISVSNPLADSESFNRRNKEIFSAVKELANKDED